MLSGNSSVIGVVSESYHCSLFNVRYNQLLAVHKHVLAGTFTMVPETERLTRHTGRLSVYKSSKTSLIRTLSLICIPPNPNGNHLYISELRSFSNPCFTIQTHFEGQLPG